MQWHIFQFPAAATFRPSTPTGERLRRTVCVPLTFPSTSGSRCAAWPGYRRVRVCARNRTASGRGAPEMRAALVRTAYPCADNAVLPGHLVKHRPGSGSATYTSASAQRIPRSAAMARAFCVATLMFVVFLYLARAFQIRSQPNITARSDGSLWATLAEMSSQVGASNLTSSGSSPNWGDTAVHACRNPCAPKSPFVARL